MSKKGKALSRWAYGRYLARQKGFQEFKRRATEEAYKTEYNDQGMILIKTGVYYCGDDNGTRCISEDECTCGYWDMIEPDKNRI